MKPSHPVNPIQSAPTHYAPSVPMSVYRELAAELRANKAVIDSLNSRNQQLLSQNQRLKQEIHNVVQATLSLGQFAGVARQAAQDEFPAAIAPHTLAKLVRAQGEARKVVPGEPSPMHEIQQTVYTQPEPSYVVPQPAAPIHPAAPSHREMQGPHGGAPEEETRRPPQPAPVEARQQAPKKRIPRPIQTAPVQVKSPERAPAPKRTANKPSAQPTVRKVAPARSPRPNMVPTAGKTLPKLFTEQTGEYRNAAIESSEDKEISGIWLALSIILIVVTAFGAGFLIMKPLLNDR